jgi:hypothetical protein
MGLEDFLEYLPRKPLPLEHEHFSGSAIEQRDRHAGVLFINV